MNILFITPVLDPKGASGGLQVTLDRLSALAQQHDVTVLCLEHVAGPLDGALANVRVVCAERKIAPRTAKSLLRSYAARLPLSVWRNANDRLLALAQEMAPAPATPSFDLVYCDHWLMWPAARLANASHRVLHLHNAEHLLFSRAAERLKGATGFVAKIEAQRSRKYLSRICAEADEVHYLSATDVALSETDGIVAKKTFVFPPTCEAPLSDDVVHAPVDGQALSIGSLSWDPTRAGLAWFFDQAWPHVTGVEFVVGGRGADTALLETLKTAPRVRYLGFVKDTEPLYGQAKVFLAPLLDGSGIKIKIINALAHGVPVVTTRAGVEGFPAGFDAFVKVCDDPREYAENTKLLATLDSRAWQQLSVESRQYARRHFAGTQFKYWCAGL